MKVLLFLTFCSLLAVTSTRAADDKRAPAAEFPVIKNYGPAYPVPGALVLPDKNLVYKVIFDVTKPPAQNDAINPGLMHAARFLNLCASVGFPVQELKLAVIVHGKAGIDVLKDVYYQEKLGRPNPNTALVEQLHTHGVELLVCGQTLADEKFSREWVNPNVGVTLSALVTLATYQLKGYSWLSF